jgi:type II secretion system protein H
MTLAGGNRRFGAFTLVELILVMAVLATIMAISAPSLSRTIRGRKLQQEASRFLALTEFAREEAISQGVPVVIWLDSDGQRYGVEPKQGYSSIELHREYPLQTDISFGKTTGALQKDSVAIEFAPDGTLETSSVQEVQFVDRFQSEISVSQRTDHWGYEIVKQTR